MKSMQRRALAAAFLLLLSACDHDAPPAVSTAESPPLDATDYFQAYQAGSESFPPSALTLVDTFDFSQRLELGPVADTQILYTGVVGQTAVQYYRPHSAYFIQDGAWRKVSLRRSGSQAPVRISAENLTTTCGNTRIVQKQFGSAADAELVYSLPDGTGDCTVKSYRRIALDDAATTPARDGPRGETFVEFRDAIGELTGLLAMEHATGTLRLYDADLANPMTLAAGASGDMYVFRSRGTDALIVYGGQLRHVDAAGALSGPLHGFVGRPAVRADDEFVYFTEPGDGPAALYRVPRDGSAAAAAIWTASAGTSVYLVAVTTASVALSTIGDDRHLKLQLLDKGTDGSASPVLLHDYGAFATLVFDTFDMPVLFVSGGNTDVHTANRLDANDALTQVENSEWVGFQYPVDYPLEVVSSGHSIGPTGAFRIDGFLGGDQHHQGGTVKRVDFVTGATEPVFEVDQTASVSCSAIGTIGMGTFYYYAPSSQGDVLSFALDNRFERHTNTPATSERPLTPKRTKPASY